MYKQAIIRRVSEPVLIDADWDKPVWRGIAPVALELYMGREPSHRPLTQVKLAWDEDFVYVVFRVEDRFVRAVADQHQQSVCQDSCVEFFFTPDGDISKGYFNLEVNCIGTILMYHQTARGQNRQIVDIDDLQSVRVATSLPKGHPIDPEVHRPTTWTVEYALPLQMLARYTAVSKPAAGHVWRANFYKCADKTSQPHWLTWSKIPLPNPDFHQPAYFGTLTFAD